MKYIYFFLILNIIILSISQYVNYSDLNDCNICTYLEEKEYYCYCKFYNDYCLNIINNCHMFYSYTKQICEESNLNCYSTNNSTFIFQDTTNNNSINISFLQEKELPKFHLFLNIFDNNKINKEILSNINITINDIQYFKYDESRAYILFNIFCKNNDYLNELSLILSVLHFNVTGEEESNETDIPIILASINLTKSKIDNISDTTIDNETENKNKTKKIVAIIFIVIGGFIIIIFIFLIIAKLTKNRVNNNLNETSNNNIKNAQEYLNIMNENKAKIDNLFKTELLSKLYNKNNTIDNCYNCFICKENFEDNSSIVVTTKCNHTFHKLCLKNWVYKNILCPKCPVCNYLLLGPESEIKIDNNNIPNLFNYITYQTETNNSTTTINDK